MARRPPKRYRPGELDAVRRKLGDIPSEEAQRIANKLGGEIGIEKNELDLRKENLRNSATGKRRHFVDVIDNTAEEPVAKFKKNSTPREMSLAGNISEGNKEFSYIDRVKTDFLCHRPEYNLKSLSGVLGTIFSLILPIPDYVNPAFLSVLEKKYINRFMIL